MTEYKNDKRMIVSSWSAAELLGRLKQSEQAPRDLDEVELAIVRFLMKNCFAKTTTQSFQ